MIQAHRLLLGYFYLRHMRKKRLQYSLFYHFYTSFFVVFGTKLVDNLVDSFDALLAFISFYVHWLFCVCYPQFFIKKFYIFITINKKIANHRRSWCIFKKNQSSKCVKKIFYIYFMSDIFQIEKFFRDRLRANLKNSKTFDLHHCYDTLR